MDSVVATSFLALINGIILFIVNRWFKGQDDKNRKIEENFDSLCKKMDEILNQNNKIIQTMIYIITEHKKNHGENTFLEHLLENLSKGS